MKADLGTARHKVTVWGTLEALGFVVELVEFVAQVVLFVLHLG
jgi:hypothetical protein